MKYLNPKTLGESLNKILKELDSVMTDDSAILEINVLRDQVDIIINQNLDDISQSIIINNLSQSDVYERVWFTTRFDGDNTMNFHVTLSDD